MKSTIIVKTEQGYVKKVMAEFTPSDYLVVSKALKLLSENEEVHEIDRGRARELHEMGFKAEIGQALVGTLTVKAVPIEKINNLINDIEVLRTDPVIIDNDNVQRFAENVLYALNNLIKEGK